MHTLPLPEVTDDPQKTKFETGNSKLGTVPLAPPVSNCDFRVSANPQENLKLETGNLKLAPAVAVSRVSNCPAGVSTATLQKAKLETGNSKPASTSTASRVSNFQFPVSNFQSPVSNFQLPVSPSSLHLTPEQLQFLLRVAPAAVATEREYEIPACVTLAQTILESATPAGWGSSSLFRLANNPFGIKYSHFSTATTSSAVEKVEKVKEVERTGAAQSSTPTTVKRVEKVQEVEEVEKQPPVASSTFSTSSTGSTFLTPSTSAQDYGHFDAATWEIENGQKKLILAQFQRFPNLEEAFAAHAQLLRAPHYRPAFAVRGDWKQFAERLGPKTSLLDREHCGYSTNPSYSAELIKLVELYRLNDPRALQWMATGVDPANRVIEPSGHLAFGKGSDGSTIEPLKSSGASG